MTTFSWVSQASTDLKIQHGALLDVVMVQRHVEVELSRVVHEFESFTLFAHVMLIVHLKHKSLEFKLEHSESQKFFSFKHGIALHHQLVYF